MYVAIIILLAFAIMFMVLYKPSENFVNKKTDKKSVKQNVSDSNLKEHIKNMNRQLSEIEQYYNFNMYKNDYDLYLQKLKEEIQATIMVLLTQSNSFTNSSFDNIDNETRDRLELIKLLRDTLQSIDDSLNYLNKTSTSSTSFTNTNTTANASKKTSWF